MTPPVIQRTQPANRRANPPPRVERIGPGRALLLLLDSIPTAHHPDGPLDTPLGIGEIELTDRLLKNLDHDREGSPT